MQPALLLIAHGSRQPEANDDLYHVVEGLERRGHMLVEASFLELVEPNIEAGGARCVAQAPGASCWSPTSCQPASTSAAI